MGRCTLLVRSEESTTISMEEEYTSPNARSIRPSREGDDDENEPALGGAAGQDSQGERESVAGAVNPEGEKEFERAGVMPTVSLITGVSEPVQSNPCNVDGDEETFPEQQKSQTDGSGEEAVEGEGQETNNTSQTAGSSNVTKLTIVVPLLSSEEPHMRSSKEARQTQGERLSVETVPARRISTGSSSSPVGTNDAAAIQLSSQIDVSGLKSGDNNQALLRPPFKRPAERSWTNPLTAELRGYKRTGELMTRNRPAAAAPGNDVYLTTDPSSSPLEMNDFSGGSADLGESADGVSRSTRDVSPEPSGVVPMEEQLQRLQRQAVEMRMRSRMPRSSGPQSQALPANATVFSCCSDPNFSSWMQTCERRNQELGRGSGVAQFRERYNFDVERGVPLPRRGDERWDWQRQQQ